MITSSFYAKMNALKSMSNATWFQEKRVLAERPQKVLGMHFIDGGLTALRDSAPGKAFTLLAIIISSAVAITVFPSQGLIAADVRLGFVAIGTASSGTSTPSSILQVTTKLVFKASGLPLSIINDGISLLQVRLCEGVAAASQVCDPPLFTTIMLPFGPDSQATYTADVPIPQGSIVSLTSIRIDHLKQTLPCNASEPAKSVRCVAVDCITVCPFDSAEVQDSGYNPASNDNSGSRVNLISMDVPYLDLQATHTSLRMPVASKSELPLCFSGAASDTNLCYGNWLRINSSTASSLPAYLTDHNHNFVPWNCNLSYYLPSTAATCLRKFSKIVMVGDSLTRTTFEYLEKFVQLQDDSEPFSIERVKYHGPQYRSTAGINMSLLFNQGVSLWDWQPVHRVSKHYAPMPGNPREQVVIIQPSRWEMFMPLHLYERNIRNVLQSFLDDFIGKVVFIYPEPSRELGIRFDLLMRNASRNVVQDPNIAARLFRVIDVFPAISNFRSLSPDGIHYSGFLSRWKMNALLNALCN